MPVFHHHPNVNEQKEIKSSAGSRRLMETNTMDKSIPYTYRYRDATLFYNLKSTCFHKGFCRWLKRNTADRITEVRKGANLLWKKGEITTRK